MGLGLPPAGSILYYHPRSIPYEQTMSTHPDFITPDERRQMPVLTTDRLVLRPMQEDDAGRVVAWRNSPHVSDVSSTQRRFDEATHREWFRSTRAERTDYVVCTKEGMNPIGSFSFKRHLQEADSRVAEMGKYIGEKSALGKGYAKEAGLAWVRFGFEYFHFAVIVAVTRGDNAANIRVNESLGFHLAEEKVDRGVRWIKMELTRAQWRHASAGA